MSAVADAAGVGRATLYRYFPALSAVMGAWHERQVVGHLDELRQVAAAPADEAGHRARTGRAWRHGFALS